MCNAYTVAHSRDEVIGFSNDIAKQLKLHLDVGGLPDDLKPRYRVSPRQRAPILRLGDDDRLILTTFQWGLLTKSAKPGFAPTNARDDKLATGWPWKMISKGQRCLVVADGFYEPTKPAGAKGDVPWRYFVMGNRQMFVMGGLWNVAPDPKTGDDVETYAVVTTAANGLIAPHDRMPYLPEADDLLPWLSPGPVPIDRIRSYPTDRMKAWQVGDRAKSWKDEGPDMIEPVDDQVLL